MITCELGRNYRERWHYSFQGEHKYLYCALLCAGSAAWREGKRLDLQPLAIYLLQKGKTLSGYDPIISVWLCKYGLKSRGKLEIFYNVREFGGNRDSREIGVQKK